MKVLFVILISLTPWVLGDFTYAYDGCNQSKACFGMPQGCLDTKDCSVVTSVQGTSEDDYKFEVYGKAISKSIYLAVGLSIDAHMGDDLVVACAAIDEASNVPALANYWNIQGYGTSILLEDPEANMSEQVVLFKDDFLYCSFSYRAHTLITTPATLPVNVSVTFDLNQNSYHLLLATGSLAFGDKLSYHTGRLGSIDAYRLSSFNDFDFDFYDGCGDTKGCFGDKYWCVEDKNCAIVFSYQGTSVEDYKFELYGKASSNSSYLAVGLSDDVHMGDDLVFACAALDEMSNVPSLAKYWNIQGSLTSILLEDPEANLTEQNVILKDGLLHCTFSYKATTEITTPTNPSRNISINLNQNVYHILLARGSLSLTDTLTYHTGRSASPEPHRLSTFNKLIPGYYDGCGDTKGCFGIPGGCLDRQDCNVIVSYQGVSVNEYSFELVGNVSNDNAYIAVALSMDNSMGDDSVVACSIQDDTSEVPGVAHYWNISPPSKTSLLLDDPNLGLSDASVTLADGLMSCRFMIKSRFTFPMPGDINATQCHSITFDLNNEPYYVLLSKGSLYYDKIYYHTSRLSSTTPVEFSDFNPDVSLNIYANCGREKGCFGDKDGCIESKNCSLVTRFYGASSESYVFEIFGDLKEGNDYVATALSTNNNMDSDSVLACIMNRTTRFPTAQMYWNGNHISGPLEDTNFGISNITGQLVNNQLYCKLTREAQTTITVPNDNTKVTFDLNQTPYHLLMSVGPISDAGLIQHHTHKAASNDSYDFVAFNSYLDHTYNDCGKRSGCMGYPSGCLETRDCSILATFSQRESGDVDFGLLASKVSDNMYVAVGLSHDIHMGDASTMFCYTNNNQGGAGMSWNIVSNNGERSSPIHEDPTYGLTNIKATFADGLLQCTFSRNKVTEIKPLGSGEAAQTFDLANEYFLILARGPIGAEKDFGFHLMDHGSNFASSPKAVNLAEFTILTEETILIKVHGSMMIMAWFFFASMGMLTARYGKDVFKDKKLFGKAMWFTIHQFCMTTTWFLTVTAVIVIFIKRKTDPMQVSRIKENPHGLVGLIAAILAFVQPFMAFFRPDSKSSKRWIFNYGHLGVGTLAMILAVVAVLLVTDLDLARLDKDATKQLTITFACCYVALHVMATLWSVMTLDTKMFTRLLLATAFISGLALTGSMIYFIADGVSMNDIM